MCPGLNLLAPRLSTMEGLDPSVNLCSSNVGQHSLAIDQRVLLLPRCNVYTTHPFDINIDGSESHPCAMLPRRSCAIQINAVAVDPSVAPPLAMLDG
jgi:hypothetical protein